MLISLEVCQRPMAEALWAVVVSLLVVFCAIAGATQRAEHMTAAARYFVSMVFSCKSVALPRINSQAAKAFAGREKKGPRSGFATDTLKGFRAIATVDRWRLPELRYRGRAGFPHPKTP